MSYIAFELDALNVARDVGAAASIAEERVTHGLLRMWAWCFREKTDTVEAIQVQGFFGVAAGPALVAFGFLESTGSTYRVRGAERYLRVTEARQKAGKVRSSGAGRSAGRFTSTPPAPDQHTTSTAPALTPSTEHRAPSTDKAAAGPVVAVVNRPTPDSAIGFWVACQDKREAAGLHRERPAGPKQVDHWFSEAMGEVHGDEQKLLKGYDAFLVDPFWRNQAEKRCAWGGWVSQWRDFVTKATAPPIAVIDPKATRSPSPVPDWTGAEAGEVQL